MTEDTDQPSAAAETGTLTESAAADLLSTWRDEEEDKPQVSSARVHDNAAERAVESAEADPEQEEAAAPDATDEESEAAEGDTEAEEGDDSYVHGNARTRLRDGTEVTIGELKKAFDKAREFERQEADFNAKRQEVDARAAQTSQQEQLFASTIQQAIAALQHTLPEEPDPRLRSEDPIAYFLQKDARETKLHDIARLQQAQQAQAQETQAKQVEQFQQQLKQEQTKLFERLPELRDETKRRDFYNDLMSSGKMYGFSDEEVNGIHDHRVMLAMRDAVAYRKLQAAKPKAVEKGKTARPVSRPDVRSPASDRASTKHKTLFERAKKTRSIDDMGALLAELD